VNGFEIFGKQIFKELSVKNHPPQFLADDLAKRFKNPQKAH